jgi:hypothetical protein
MVKTCFEDRKSMKCVYEQRSSRKQEGHRKQGHYEESVSAQKSGEKVLRNLQY